MLTALEDSWGWVGARLTAHDGGMNSLTWWVDHDEIRAVAKWVPRDEARHLQAGVAAALLAGSDGLATGTPYAALDGRLWADVDEGCLVLLALVPGVELSGEDPDDQERIGAALARAHRQTVGHVVSEAWQQFWVDPAAAHLGVDEEVRTAVAKAVAAVRAIPSDRLTHGVGHGDPAPEAFLHDGDSTGLIDWGSAVNGPLLHDLASAAMYLGGLGAAAPMLRAYVDAGGPVPAYEIEAYAVAFLTWRWAVQADYFAGRLALEDTEENRGGLADARRRLVPA